MGRPDPEELARMRDNDGRALHDDRAGSTREDLDPTFDEFMEKFGDFFPGAENLEDVVRMMAERAAAAEAMFNSLSPDSAERAAFDVRRDDGEHGTQLLTQTAWCRTCAWRHRHRLEPRTPDAWRRWLTLRRRDLVAEQLAN